MRQITISIAAAASLLLCGCASAPPAKTARDGSTLGGYESVMRVAAVSRDAGDYEMAASLFRKATQLSPDRREPLQALGDMALQAGRFDDAVTAYRSALKLAKASPELSLGLAKAYIAGGQAGLAVETLKASLKDAPNDTKILDTLGIASDLAGDHEGAQDYYRRGLAIDPRDGAIANNLSLSLAITGDYDRAVAVLRPFADGAGATPRERQTLSLIYGLIGNLEAAGHYADADLDAASVSQNLAYFARLRGLPQDQRARALVAASWDPRH